MTDSRHHHVLQARAMSIGLSKAEHFKQILSDAIDRGEYVAGAQIPTEQALVERYGISRTTVREAVGALVHEGRLERVQGRGTFVTGTSSEVTTQGPPWQTFLVLSQSADHLYAPVTAALCTEFQRRGLLPVVLDTLEAERDVDAAVQTLKRVVHSGSLGGVVVDGRAAASAELAALWPLISKTGARFVVIDPIQQFSSVADVEVTTHVTSDLVAGVRLGTEHLLTGGHRHVLFVIHQHRDSSPDYSGSLHQQLTQVLRNTLANAGPDARADFIYVEPEFRQDPAAVAQLVAALESEQRPTAIFGFGDYRAKFALDTAIQFGLNVPDDLAVLGFFDTPWTAETIIPLSSVSLRGNAMAKLAVDRLLSTNTTLPGVIETLTVQPQLVARESTTGRTQSEA